MAKYANVVINQLVSDVEHGLVLIEDIRPELTKLFNIIDRIEKSSGKENHTKPASQEDMAIYQAIADNYKTPKVLITMNGGLVQRIVGNASARNAGLRVIIADYDIEGVHPESIMLDVDGDELTYVEGDLDEIPCDIENSLLNGEVTPANDDDAEGESA